MGSAVPSPISHNSSRGIHSYLCPDASPDLTLDGLLSEAGSQRCSLSSDSWMLTTTNHQLTLKDLSLDLSFQIRDLSSRSSTVDGLNESVASRLPPCAGASGAGAPSSGGAFHQMPFRFMGGRGRIIW